MMGRCRSVQRRVQLYFDGEATLADRDVLHIHACPRCGGVFRRYSRFRADLRIASGNAVSALASPDWGTVFQASVRENDSAVATGTSVDTAGGPRRVRGFTRPATATLTKAAALLVFVGIGAFVGTRVLQVSQARSYLHSDTTEFVDTLFSSPFFPTAPETPVSLGSSSSWFDATPPSTELPPIPHGLPAPN